jgi:hypothetical protein
MKKKGAQSSHGVKFTVGKATRPRSATGISRLDSQRKWTLVRGEEAPIGVASLVDLERRLAGCTGGPL